MKLILTGSPDDCFNGSSFPNWRHWFEEHTSERWAVVDLTESTPEGWELRCNKWVVDTELTAIKSSDALIVNLDVNHASSFNACMQMVHAWAANMLIIVIAPPDKAVPVHAVYHSTAIAHSYAEALQLLENAVFAEDEDEENPFRT